MSDGRMQIDIICYGRVSAKIATDAHDLCPNGLAVPDRETVLSPADKVLDICLEAQSLVFGWKPTSIEPIMAE